MDVKDAAAREELLEDWVAGQRRLHQSPDEIPKLTRRAKARMRWARGLQRLANRLFDRRLETLLGSTEPEHEHPERINYVASDWHVLPRALRFIGVSEDDVFLDLGCGKGRVVHQAALRPFRRVIGVEISPVLAEAARKMLAEQYRRYRCKDIEIVVADATGYRIPDEVTVVYLFHPFHDATFTTVLGNLIDSLERRPRQLRLIYCYPSGAEQVLASGRFRPLTEQRSRLLDTYYSRTTIFESV